MASPWQLSRTPPKMCPCCGGRPSCLVKRERLRIRMRARGLRAQKVRRR